jgi:hypothetical protein
LEYPFRIEAPSPLQAANASKQDQLTVYTDKLIRLIPAEIITIYLSVRGYWTAPSGTANENGGFLGIWPLICVILLLISRSWGTRNANGNWKSVQIGGIVIAAISFIIWVYAMGHSVLGFVLPDSRYAATAVIVWVFLVSAIYKRK